MRWQVSEASYMCDLRGGTIMLLLICIALVTLLLIWLWHEITHASDIPGHEQESREQQEQEEDFTE